jgi:hypothetical protein
MPVLKFEISVQNNHLSVTPSILNAKKHYGDTPPYEPVELPFNDVQVSGVVTLLSAIGSKIEDRTYEFYEDYRKFREDQRQQWMVKEEILTPEKKINPGFREKIGKKLYDVLFRDDNVKTVLINARNDQESLLIQLAIKTDNPDDSQNNSKLLYDYPWELLWEKNSSFLANDKIRFDRYILLPSPPPELPKVQLLKVLLLFPNAEDQEHKLCKLPETKLQQLRQAIQGENRNQISLLNLSENIITYDALQQYLNQNRGDQSPNVIHFEGHGLFGKKCVCNRLITDNQQRICPNSECKRLLDQPQGYLLFQTDKGKPHYVSADDLGKLLVEHNHSLRLVVLSACESSWSRGSNSVFKGVAQRLIEKGVPAVVAMQYPVLIDSATRFAEAFYASLHQRDSLADAVGKARKFMEVNGSTDQWYRPVLYLRWADNPGGELFEEPEPVVEKTPEVEIDWHGICSDLFRDELKKSSNNSDILNGSVRVPILKTNGEDNYLYQDMKLVERNPQHPHKQIEQNITIEPGNTSQANEPDPVNESQEYKLDSLFMKILSGEIETQKSQGKRIAILGQPGSGKTVGLLRITQLILDSQHSVPIMVDFKMIQVYLKDLKDLKNRTTNLEDLEQITEKEKIWLKSYLFENWLVSIVREARISMEDGKARFEKLLSSGKVWLLLDGLNEIGSKIFGELHDQLKKPWAKDIKVVLTCRLNEWEASGGSLIQAFDTFRLLRYEDSQRNEYINRRFKGDQTKIDGLIAEIDRHSRLKDLAKNPLCLAMLCGISGRYSINLLRTRFQLYKKFEEVYFEEKTNVGDNTLDILREELGKLSLEVLKNQSSPFLLTESFITNTFFKGRQDIINLVMNSGWLNNIGKSEYGAIYYTFFHPSFQEYFASQAIDDWDYFLPKEHTEEQANIKIPPKNPDGDYKPYRIFESKWKEVILLWMGREVDNAAFRTKKEKFIRNLIEFQDGWENFYGYRAHFLAAEGITEFQDCPQREEIVMAVVEWSLDIFNDENKKQSGETKTFTLPIRQAAIDVLQRTDRDLLRSLLLIIRSDVDLELIQLEPEKIEQISEQVDKILAFLKEGTPYNFDDKSQIPSEIVINNENERRNKIDGIIAAAKQLIENCANYQNHPVFWQAIERLGEIGKGNQEAINFLIDVFDLSKGNKYLYIRLKSALHLAAIGISHTTQNGEILEDRKVEGLFLKIITFNSELQNLRDEDSIRETLLKHLPGIGISEPETLVLSRLLVFYIQLTGKRDIRELRDVASKIIKELISAAGKIKTLGEYQSQTEYKTTFEQLQKLSLPSDAYRKMIRYLGEYLSSEREEEIKIHSDTEAQPSEWSKLQTKWSELQIADYLDKNGQPLKPSERFRDCYKTLWYCAQVMPYPEFYSAFNQESSSNE